MDNLVNTALEENLLSPEDQQLLYNRAHADYLKGHYNDAYLMFRQLVIADPHEEKFWRGYAACLQLLEKYEEALHAWAVVAILEIDDPAPHFHAAECYYFLEDEENGKKALALAEARATVDGPIVELIPELKRRFT